MYSSSRLCRIPIHSGVDPAVNLLTRRSFLLWSGVAFASYLLYEVNALRVVHYTVPVRNLPRSFEDFTILLLSDLHQKRFGTNQARLLASIKRHPYDMIALTGDIVNRFHPDGEPAMELVARLKPKPIYFVNGNNEWAATHRYGFRITGRLAAAGVTVLDNEAVILKRNGEQLRIAGVDDLSSGKEALTKALPTTGNGTPTILLSHSPLIFPRAAAAGVDLILAGHTHGGQIRVPFLGTLWAPDLGLLPRWDYGEYHQDHTTLIITGGLGESILPIRFNIPPEIVFITLTPLKGN